MTKAELAMLIDSYADAKASSNKYLVQRMIGDLEEALNALFPAGEPEAPQTADPSPEY